MDVELESNRYMVHDMGDAIDFCFRQEWTDGLPVVPPTVERVTAMLQAAKLAPSKVIGEVPARASSITAEQVAVNAVLAGCLPEYMPVVVAAIEALSDPQFQVHGPGATTSGPAVLTIVNGPVARKFGVNSGSNLFGPGWRANLTIGRTIRLVMRNVLGSIPGVLDMATFGHPGRLSYVIAENEEESPWAPLHVDRGYTREQSTVTLMAAAGPRQVLNQISDDPEGILTTIADDMRITAGITWQSYFVVLLGGEHMKIIERAGWSKSDVRRFLFESTMTSYAHLKRTNRAAMPITMNDEIRMRPLASSEDDFWIIPAGGSQGPFSCYIPGWMDDFWSYATTKEVKYDRAA